MNEKFRGKLVRKRCTRILRKKSRRFCATNFASTGAPPSSTNRGVEASLEKSNATVAGAFDMSDTARRLAAEPPGIEALYRSVALEINGLAVSSQHDAAIAAIDTRW
ncbi:hypothetical protein [Paraburkholderia youngii]|uniref:hypothetical protein n=1 Tax=Paraburkholderia youngii TaxID=2782701 RepID=UPI00159502F7|nr:hypothetical protein [Paraburkholderia youngii]